MAAAKEESRKGPWTEEEDLQLVCSVRLLGDRRWDFIAKVSGLHRTGKSCRLRWVNYLHPGLKRGRMSPQEERVVLELHARWGNRWSRIARQLPGRTDNEIKNYWRTHVRKRAQEWRTDASPPAAAPSPPLCPLDDESGTAAGGAPPQGAGAALYGSAVAPGDREEVVAGYPMDQIWSAIEPAGGTSEFACGDAAVCPPWGGLPCDSPWKMDDEELRAFASPGGLSGPGCHVPCLDWSATCSHAQRYVSNEDSLDIYSQHVVPLPNFISE